MRYESANERLAVAHYWTSAAQIPLLPDDEIVSVDGTPIEPLIAGLDINEAAVKVAARLRGPAGTQVKLEIRRAPSQQLFAVTLTRADIVIPSVDSSRAAPTYAASKPMIECVPPTMRASQAAPAFVTERMLLSVKSW